MSAALHLDLVHVDRAIAAAGIRQLLELVNEDPPGLVLRCDGCGVASLVQAANDHWTKRSYLHTWTVRHRACGGSK